MTHERGNTVRRSGLADRRISTEESRLAQICLEAGAIFMGIQRGIPGFVETIVLFDPRHIVTQLGRPTLGIPISKFSLAAVKLRLAESEKRFKPGGQIEKKD
jgi:hypothetical protein